MTLYPTLLRGRWDRGPVWTGSAPSAKRYATKGDAEAAVLDVTRDDKVFVTEHLDMAPAPHPLAAADAVSDERLRTMCTERGLYSEAARAAFTELLAEAHERMNDRLRQPERQAAGRHAEECAVGLRVPDRLVEEIADAIAHRLDASGGGQRYLHARFGKPEQRATGAG